MMRVPLEFRQRSEQAKHEPPSLHRRRVDRVIQSPEADISCTYTPDEGCHSADVSAFSDTSGQNRE